MLYVYLCLYVLGKFDQICHTISTDIIKLICTITGTTHKNHAIIFILNT